jgi:alkanesulfonate monooxygenase SsuD/methylene tetrahydromethanopterin reductase-like flavin-dependent oxidoreductase (luciferase family)
MGVSVVPGNIAAMRYGLDISPAGNWGRPDQIAELATLAEDHGWDGVFCEDYLAFPGGLPTYDVWVTLGLVAQATTRLTIGTMVTPLPARHPPTVALQAASVATLSGGRLVLGVGSGDPGGDPAIGDGTRADLLESALTAVRTACPAVPIWVGGALTKPAPRARALRWDGSCLYRLPPPDWEDLTPGEVAGLRADAGRASYVVAVGGRERRDDLAAERRYVASLADAGADWWQEYVPPRLPLEEARRRIVAGPVAA